MKTIAVLFVGMILGAGVVWYVIDGQKRSDVRKAQGRLATEADHLKDKVHDAVDSFDGERIKEELARTGKVVRQKAKQVGDAVMDATADARTTARIKGRIALDQRMAALKISVDTTDGLVTLSGTVSSYEDIGRVMKLALETGGVREVVSTLQVRQSK